jgi:hypothetical protein
MPDEVIIANRLMLNVLHLLYHRGEPAAPGDSFPAYIDYIGALSPITFRNQVIDSMADECRVARQRRSVSIPPPTASALLSSLDTYLYWLSVAWPNHILDGKLNLDAHRLLNDPGELHQRFLTHMQRMWGQYLQDDWERSLPFLEACISAYQQIDFSGLTVYEAIYRLVGRPASDFENHGLDDASLVIFIPNMHVGYYLGRFGNRASVRLTFQAHLPDSPRQLQSQN